MSNETEKSSTKYTHELIAIDPVNAGYAFPRVQFSENFRGEHVPGQPCITHSFGADSPLVSTVIWCLMQLQKNSIPG